MEDRIVRRLLVFRAGSAPSAFHESDSALERHLCDKLRGFLLPEFWDSFRVVGRPSTWRLTGPLAERLSAMEEHRLEHTSIVAAISFRLPARRPFRAFLEELDSAFRSIEGFVAAGADPQISSALWAPGLTFGTRKQADILIGKQTLLTHTPPLRGSNVNVVVVDQGFDASRFPAAHFCHGWGTPGRVPGKGNSEHAAMIVRNVLDLAPDACLFDCPLIPPSIPGLPPSIADIATFLDEAVALWDEILLFLWFIDTFSIHTGPWVFVHPWSIYDRRTEVPPGDYTQNPDHPFNLQIQQTINWNCDVVFAAGNCGGFDPDRRCGSQNRGPCRSIWGANSLKDVLTVGAARVDTTWLGYSSQGPGQEELGHDKPNLCAPSQFAENEDAAEVTSGTSGAAGLAGGAVAALRGTWSSTGVKPAVLNAHLAKWARQATGTGWNDRLGFGILDLDAALKDPPFKDVV